MYEELLLLSLSPVQSSPDSLLLHASLKDEREALLSHAMYDEERDDT